jgi:hypothetical protein
MGGKKTRKRFKVQELPGEIREAINRKIVEGHTYDQVKAWIDEMADRSASGVQRSATTPRDQDDELRTPNSELSVSRSAIARYGKDFLGRLERVRMVQEQAKAILTETEGPGMELEEAASKLFSQMLMETLLDLDDLKAQDITDLLHAFGKIQGSSVSRERLKAQMRQKAEKAVAKIEKTVGKGLSPGAVEEIRRQILGIAR